MASKVTWSLPAVVALEEIERYIARDSQRYADAVIGKIVSSGRNLELFPRMGRRVPELDDDRYRELIVYRYRVIYRIDYEDVTILNVVHGARELPPDVTSR